MIFALVSFLLFFNGQAGAKNVIKVKALGSSPKGQFVAFEEFGYLNGAKVPFARVRVKNVWKNKYVNRVIKVISEKEEMKLDQVRAKAKEMAREKLERYNISI